MPTTPESDGDIATLSANELFLDLLCADEDLLKAEFDAIIAAAWSSPPPDKPDHADPERRPHRARHQREANDAAPRSQAHHSGFSRWTRQRSPAPVPPKTNDK